MVELKRGRCWEHTSESGKMKEIGNRKEEIGKLKIRDLRPEDGTQKKKIGKQW